ncbi:MAG: type II toxin-antitoxin system RelE/ParE family toxin [Mesorhizobium sp.]
MMRVVDWSNDAARDFDDAIEFITTESDVAAMLVANRILTAVDLLAEIPTGRRGRVGGTYEKPVQKTPYIVAYSLTNTSVTILRIIHSARDWPQDQWPDDA